METFCYRGHFVKETFCRGDILLRRRFVRRRFVEETFCKETLGMCVQLTGGCREFKDGGDSPVGDVYNGN